jgi:beta-lactamase superfamily II metal-dependent hydrolase
MSSPAITLEALPVAHGDSLLLSCPVGKRTWRMLIDTGPEACWPVLEARLRALPADSQGRRHLDRLVITHIDHDHIGAVQRLLSDSTLGLTVGDVWFNAPPRPAARGVDEGQSLANRLGAPASAQSPAWPWNQAFKGQPAVTGDEGAILALPAGRGEPRLTLLSPTAVRLQRLFAVWNRELATLQANTPALVSSRAAPTPPRDLGQMDLQALAATSTPLDQAPANGSSLAFLLEHRGASVLLGADAYAPVLAAALRTLAVSRQLPLPLKVDVFKLNHHGSRGNVTRDLLEVVRADHYIVSTNGAIFNHPDDEALARVVAHGGIRPTLWFNQDTPRMRRWDDAGLRARYGYQVQWPLNPAAGVVLTLPARPTP